MAYDGHQYKGVRTAQLPVISGEDPYVYVVSGSTRWGHALLRTASGWFHISQPGFTYPFHIPTEDDFETYLEENDKFVLGALHINDVNDFEALGREIRRSLNTTW